jgi:hypothetical protein
MTAFEQYLTASGYTCETQIFHCLADTKLVMEDSARFLYDTGMADCFVEAGLKQAREMLLDLGSVISEPHLAGTSVHAMPQIRDERRVGYRPPRYGRAAIFELPIKQEPERMGLVDIKGVGVGIGRTPRVGGTKTGVLFLHEALVEVINAAVLKRLFARDGVSLETVPFYAVVATGIAGKVAWAETPLPCATLVRKAVIRPQNNNELPLIGSIDEQIHHKIETYLLSRGLTTTGTISTLSIAREDGRWAARLNGEIVASMTEEICVAQLAKYGLVPPQIIHFANVQIGREAKLQPLSACLIDLGHLRVVTGLCGHLATFVDDAILNWGMTTLQTHPDWPGPVAGRAVQPERLAYRLVGAGGAFLPEGLRKWLRPTEKINAGMAGVVFEALSIVKGFVVDHWTVSDVEAAVEQIALEAVP